MGSITKSLSFVLFAFSPLVGYASAEDLLQKSPFSIVSYLKCGVSWREDETMWKAFVHGNQYLFYGVLRSFTKLLHSYLVRSD